VHLDNYSLPFSNEVVLKKHMSTRLIFFIKYLLESYMYIFMKIFVKTDLLIWLSHFQTQRLKRYS
jgi:hypothetical protein